MTASWGRLAAIAALTLAAAGSGSAAIIGAGKAAPAWTGKTVAGKPITSKQYQKKVVLMNFFSYT